MILLAVTIGLIAALLVRSRMWRGIATELETSAAAANSVAWRDADLKAASKASEHGVVCVVFAVLLIPMFFLVNLFVSWGIDRRVVAEWDVPILSVADSVGAEGNGSRFRFVIRQEGQFTFYADQGDHTTMETIPARSTKVVFTETSPRIAYTCSNSEPKTSLWYISGIVMAGKQRCTFVLHVPRGSIVEEFELDAN